jgi:uncharacterized protein (TIGR03032 family)
MIDDRPIPPVPAASPPGEVLTVEYEYTAGFVEVLESLSCCLLVSNYYRGGQVAVVGAHAGGLSCAFHAFEHALGVAVRPDRVAVATRRQVYFLHAAPDLAPRIPPAGTHDGCYLTRKSHVTGEVQAHELGWSDDGGLWIVNTLFSCLCTLDDEHSFVPRWAPPFVSALAAEDRCHLNGLAMAGGAPRYVSALGETDTPQGWRPTKDSGGCVVDVPARAVVARGLAMPHSPRVYDGRLWVLDSGRGQLSVVNPADGRVEPVATLPGYARGLSLVGHYAFVGLSKGRRITLLDGLPIGRDLSRLRCGVRVVDLRTGQVVVALDFLTAGMEEIFGVEIVPGVRLAALTSPNPLVDGRGNVWYMPGAIG